MKKPKCKDKKVDIVFVLDSSTSVGPDNWRRELKFLADLTRPLTIGSRAARVAFVTYNTRAKVQFGFNTYSSSKSLQNAIMSTKFSEGLTFTGEALKLVLKELVPKMRRNVPRMLFLVTDGKANGETRPESIAKRLKAQKVNIFSIGIANAIDR